MPWWPFSAFQRLEVLQLETLRRITLMTAALDRLTQAVDGNSAATDALSDEVQVAIDYIKAHPAAGNDPELLALAARLVDKNAKAVAAKDALEASMAVVSASGGPATP